MFRSRGIPGFVPHAALGLSVLAPALAAQQSLWPHPMPGPVRDLGTYHLASGTWTRGGGQESFGPKTLYANTANSGYFGTMGVAADLVWTDEGRIPSTGGHANAVANGYLVDGWTFGYCSSVVGALQTGSISFYDCYASCSDPRAATPVASFPFSLPGAATSTACWMVTFDVQGTTLEWTMNGDCDGVFDGTSALDDFGWTISLSDQGTGGQNGPLLAGDPNNYAYGDGTYYQNPPATYATGLGTTDQFWLLDSTGSYANGCYWFGGYVGGNPFSSFALQLHGDAEAGDYCNKYCIATPNSTGAPASIWIDAAGCSGNTDHALQLTAYPVPNQFGLFFHGQNQVQVPFGNGYLCTTVALKRACPALAADNVASFTYPPGAFSPGMTRNFQYWVRDPMGGGALFNTSNAVSVAFVSGSGTGDGSTDCGGGGGGGPKFFQLDYEIDGVQYWNTDWGMVEVPIPDSAVSVRFVNLAVDGRWELGNIPVARTVPPGTVQKMSYYFDLGVTSGVDVTSLTYDYVLSDVPLQTMPQGSNGAPVTAAKRTVWSGIQNELLTMGPATGYGILEGPPEWVGHGIRMINQEQECRECVPASISNSLKFLKQRWNLDVDDGKISKNKIKQVVGQDNSGTNPDVWPGRLKDYLDSNGLPIESTLKTQDVLEAWNGLRDDHDVLVGSAKHLVTVTAMYRYPDGVYVIQFVDDLEQGRPGGTRELAMTYFPYNTSFMWGGPEFNFKQLWGFVIDKPRSQ